MTEHINIADDIEYGLGWTIGEVIKTAVIQIGNSDNKLTQDMWAQFVETVNNLVEISAYQVLFFGGSPNWYPWQNMCWVIDIETDKIIDLKSALTAEKKSFKQNSIAITIGETEYI